MVKFVMNFATKSIDEITIIIVEKDARIEKLKIVRKCEGLK